MSSSQSSSEAFPFPFPKLFVAVWFAGSGKVTSSSSKSHSVASAILELLLSQVASDGGIGISRICFSRIFCWLRDTVKVSQFSDTIISCGGGRFHHFPSPAAAADGDCAQRASFSPVPSARLAEVPWLGLAVVIVVAKLGVCRITSWAFQPPCHRRSFVAVAGNLDFTFVGWCHVRRREEIEIPPLSLPEFLSRRRNTALVQSRFVGAAMLGLDGVE
nr:hypothetical protein KK1_000469 [Ipomoea batatas]